MKGGAAVIRGEHEQGRVVDPQFHELGAESSDGGVHVRRRILFRPRIVVLPGGGFDWAGRERLLPGECLGGKSRHDFRVLPGEVVLLGGVGGNVIQFEAAAVGTFGARSGSSCRTTWFRRSSFLCVPALRAVAPALFPAGSNVLIVLIIVARGWPAQPRPSPSLAVDRSSGYG